MRVGVVALVVAPWALVACSHENDVKDAAACPTVSAEELWESEESDDYLADLEELTGATISGPDDLATMYSDASGDAYATFFSITCGDAGAPPGSSGPCPDVATSDAFAIGRDPDVDFDAVMKAIDCDGVVSEREERCLRSPWSRNPAFVGKGEFAPSPKEAVRLVAGAETVITGVLSRTGDRARFAVQLDGAEGVYDVQRLRRGWVTVSGEGCASGVAVSDWDEEISEECQQAIDEATPDDDGMVSVACVDDVD